MIWHSPQLGPLPEGDAELGALMRRAKVEAPRERIASTDWLVTAANAERIKVGERFAVLDCGHTVVTRNLNLASCWQCHYLLLNGFDYEAFRRGEIPDPMHGHWQAVPRPWHASEAMR